jgi:hypothetical protein
MSTQYNDAVTFTNTVIMVGQFTPPAGSFYDQHINAAANISADKLQHPIHLCGSQSGSAAAAAQAAHVGIGSTGTLKAFKAGCIGPCTGNATITLDLKKNGTSVLSSPITLNNGQAAYAQVAAVLNTTSYTSGDVLTVVITVNAGSGVLGTGLFWEFESYETAV